MSDLKVPNSFNVHNHDLKEDEIHIWLLCVSELHSYLDGLYSFLNQEERNKASLFRNIAYKNSYITTRGGLRHLMGCYIGQKPKDVDISYNKWGKPQVAEKYSLNFSLSHSVDYSIVAFTKLCEIGIDIEFVNPDLNMDELVTVFLNSTELDHWQTIPSKMKTEYFYKLWVGKEAFIKALGKGWLERKEIINSLTLLSDELEHAKGILKTHQGILHYLNIIPNYKSAFFSTSLSLIPRIFNLK